MIFFNKTSWKFLGIFTAIVAVSLVIIYTAAFFNPEVRKEMAAEVYAEKYIEDLREKYKNDTYGGETPEETLTLFTQALEDGDVELASKYFIVEKQEKMKEELNIEKENDVLKLIIADLKKKNRFCFI